MAPVYSERLLMGRSAGGYQRLIIPAARRCVVRFVSITTHVGQPDYVVLYAHGFPVLWMNGPTPQVTKHYDVRCVLYAGEWLEMVTAGGDVAWHVAGFMFSDA